MEATLSPPEPIDAPLVRSQRHWTGHALRAVMWVIVILVLWISLVEGLRLRWWVFNLTDPIRFINDTARGSYWGLIASGPEGYWNQYDKMDPEVPEWENSQWVPWLDYGPLRLLVMREWGEWQRKYHPPDPNLGSLMDAWQRDYWFNAPVIRFNIALEMFAAVCAFFLTRLWVIRGSVGEIHGPFHGTWQAVVAALMIWFSADIIISAHAWFQWDSWAVPWYLCACLLGSLDWWFAAGLAVAIGVMFKGQMISVAPIFLIWPLVQGRVGAALRWICGVVFATAVITSGWLITYIPPDTLQTLRDTQSTMQVSQYPIDLFKVARVFDVPAAVWIIEMLVVAAAVPWLLRTFTPKQDALQETFLKRVSYSRWTWVAVGAVLIFCTVYWPWLLARNRPSWYLGLLAGGALAAAVLFLRRGSQRYVLAAIAAGGMLSLMGLFHGSTSWWDCGFHYGSVHWPYMVTGPASNVPATFQLRFGWAEQVDQIAFTLPAIHGHWPHFVSNQGWWPAVDMDVTAKTFFDSIYGVLLVICGIAIGIQAKRNDRRVLVAMVTPWIMFFLFPVQIQERYLLYAAGASACCIGNSVGTALLGLLLTLFSAAMHMIRLLDWNTADLDTFGQNLSTAFPRIFSPDSGHTMLQYMQSMHPDMMWGVLVVGMTFLYLSVTPSRKNPRVKARRTHRTSTSSVQASDAAKN
jgi:hypothetical protein